MADIRPLITDPITREVRTLPYTSADPYTTGDSVGGWGSRSFDYEGFYEITGASINVINSPPRDSSGVTGLNDMILSFLEGSPKLKVSMSYTVTIDSTGSPDTFSWTDTEGNSGTFVPIVAATPIELSYGITVTFANATGHTIDDTWVAGLAVDNISSFVTTNLFTGVGDTLGEGNGMSLKVFDGLGCTSLGENPDPILAILGSGSQFIINRGFSGGYAAMKSDNMGIRAAGASNGFIEYGDLDWTGNACVNMIDDPNLRYIIDSNNSGMIIHNSPPAYANDAAAISDGLSEGDWYQTDGTDLSLPFAGLIRVVQP